MNKLNQIGIKHGTDKSSEVHNYLYKYQKYLPFRRDDDIKILEIGVQEGKSTKMWKEYFYNSFIVGLDIDANCKNYQEYAISIEIGSQNDVKFLNDIKEKYEKFNMILDDGSHMNSDIIISFENLWDCVAPGGVYIVEDCVTSYWEEYGGGLRKEWSVMEYFKRLCDEVNFYGIKNPDAPVFWARKEDYCIETLKKSNTSCRTDIESINFLNSIIIITKR